MDQVYRLYGGLRAWGQVKGKVSLRYGSCDLSGRGVGVGSKPWAASALRTDPGLKQLDPVGAEVGNNADVRWEVEIRKKCGYRRMEEQGKPGSGESGGKPHAPNGELRKQLAEKEAVPVYAVFTNEQLAAMVTARERAWGQVNGESSGGGV